MYTIMSYEETNPFVNTSQPFLKNPLMFPFLSVSQPTSHLKCNHYFTLILIISLLHFFIRMCNSRNYSFFFPILKSVCLSFLKYIGFFFITFFPLKVYLLKKNGSICPVKFPKVGFCWLHTYSVVHATCCHRRH